MYPIEKYEFKVFEKTNEDGSKSSVVIALSTFAGRVVKGVAKCIASDPFSLEKGKQLAAARCDIKVCMKRKKRALDKKKEVARKIEELNTYYNKMCSYYDDALNECVESLERLKLIEEELG